MGVPMTTWYQDPTGRHQERLHDGVIWTDQVRDRGVVNSDPVGLAAPATAIASAPIAPPGRVPVVVPTQAAVAGSGVGAAPSVDPAARRNGSGPLFRFRPFRAIRNILAILGVASLIATYSYGHSTEFKVECAAHKLLDLDMGWFKNRICDANFDIK